MKTRLKKTCYVLMVILTHLMITGSFLWAQIPDKLTYQAVVRNSSNQLVVNQAVGIRISILQGSVTGPEVYSEVVSPSPVTNENGLLSIEFGGGTGFNTIDWKTGVYFLKTEIDPTGGAVYTIEGVSRLLSVPYAFYATRAENIAGDIPETDPTWMGTADINGAVGRTGNVGIGNIAPTSRLHVNNPAGITQNAATFINAQDADNANGLDIYTANTTNGAYILRARTAVTTPFVISSNGNVGFRTSLPTRTISLGGQTSQTIGMENRVFVDGPGFNLTINAGGSFEGTDRAGGHLNLESGRSTGTGSSNIYFRTPAPGTSGNDINSPSVKMTIMGSGRVGIGTISPTARFHVTVPSGTTENAALIVNNQNENNANGLYIYTANTSSSGYLLDARSGTSSRFHVKPNGNVGIGTNQPSQTLDVNGTARIRFIGSGTYSTAVNRTSDGTLTTATSDARMKDNISVIDGGLGKVLKLRGVTFTWKDEPGMGQRIGLIAQEVEAILPELVFTNEEDGYKGINYPELTAVLIEAIKEQQGIIENLEQKMEQFSAENALLLETQAEIIRLKEEFEVIRLRMLAAVE